MIFEFPLFDEVDLLITSRNGGGLPYPSTRIQKGLILRHAGRELCEEGVGFGVPVLKRGLQTIFPGEVTLQPSMDGLRRVVIARYTMNLEERISTSGSRTLHNPLLYASKNFLAAGIRQLQPLRTFLTSTSSLLRSTLNLKTTYELTHDPFSLELVYSSAGAGGQVRIEMDGLAHFPQGVSEVVIMNEQGARTFDEYQDADGVHKLGRDIGCWDLVSAREASFISHAYRVAFSLGQVEGAKLYRGRELVGNRLAWSGFGYTFPPSLGHFSCEVAVKALPGA